MTPTAPPDPHITVTLCRGCCCGSTTKHPSTDHDGQRTALEALSSESVRVQVVDCIDRCTRSNVVLVRQLIAPGKRRDTWFGAVHYRAQTNAIAEWISGECATEIPVEVARLRIPPP